MKKLSLLIIIVFSLVSCNQESYLIETENEGISTFEDYLKFFNADTDAKILIQSSSSLGSTSNIYNISSLTNSDRIPYSYKMDNDLFEGTDVYRSSDNSNWIISDKDLSSFFGKRVKLELNGNVVEAKTITVSDSNKEVYIPQLLQVSLSGLRDGKVVPGTVITWNEDTKNKRGIIITSEYKPLDQSNQTIATTYTQPIMRGDVIEDKGSYTVTSTDLSYFPDGSTISFHIGRAGFVNVATSGESDYSVGGYTTIRGDYSIAK